jgi:hypothetical protein
MLSGKMATVDGREVAPEKNTSKFQEDCEYKQYWKKYNQEKQYKRLIFTCD